MPGVTVKDVDAQAFVEAYAKYLKRSGRVTLPKYVDYAKTATFKELAPQDPDWYYVRCGK
jgi:small subunit ribosomal protein S19e